MENEMKNFFSVVITILTSLSYCHFVCSRIPIGIFRFLSLIPIMSIFTLLPLHFSSVLLQSCTGMFIAWLANFKLLLFAFGRYPSSSSSSSTVSLMHFITITSLPITIQQNSQNKKYPSLQHPENVPFSWKSFAGRILFWSIMAWLYNYKQYMPRYLGLIFYTGRMFAWIQIIFILAASMTKLWFMHELEPQFHNPHLAASAQEFWGRRWNLSVSCVLRSLIHEPIRFYFTPFLGKRWALNLAILSTFGVSGAMHEVTYFYVGRVWPTWEVMWFFVINGIYVVIEIEVKKGLIGGSWMLHRWAFRCSALLFLIFTAIPLLYIQLIKCGADDREIDEYGALLEYVKSKIYALHDYRFNIDARFS